MSTLLALNLRSLTEFEETLKLFVDKGRSRQGGRAERFIDVVLKDLKPTERKTRMQGTGGGLD